MVPISALFGRAQWRFPRSAYSSRQLAAIGVIIQDLQVRVFLTSWRLAEAHVIDETSQNTHDIRELAWLVEHNFRLVVFLVSIECPIIEGLEVFLVEPSRSENQKKVMIEVGGHRFVERIVAHDVGVACLNKKKIKNGFYLNSLSLKK